jgi:predicted DNA-binding transcriptional regulator YafY
MDGKLGSMLETSARLLRLLSLLQARRDWSGAELAERLGVSARTVRRDVERLRGLGYPVHATSGVAGGYRLGAGAALPPLLLDDDEVVAVAVGLRTAAGGSVAGIQETSVRALVKLEQVLPSRLRHRVNALWTSTVPVPVPADGATVDAEVLTAIAGACRDHQRLRFDYRDHAGSASVRTVEPHRLVCWGRRWYLLAWDTDRNDWRTFRVDRLQPRTPTGPRFTPRDLPDDDVAAHVTRGVWSAGWRYRARVTLHAPAETVAERIPPAVGLLQAVDTRTCVLDTGADTLDTLAVYLSMLGVDFEVGEPPDLVEHIRKLADRYSRATR